MKSIDVIDLHFSFDSHSFFRGLDLSVERGEIVGLIGPNGSGKTTLINLIRGFLPPDKGQIFILGRDIRNIPRREMGKLVSLVPQESKTAFNFTAFEIALMGRYSHRNHDTGASSGEDHDIVMEALRFTNSERFARSYFWKLSGGEKQRVILSRAIAQRAEIILLDEPTSSLDLKQAVNIYHVIKELNASRKVTILAATHDIHLARRFCHRMIMLKDGVVHGDGTPELLFQGRALEKLFDIEA